ncbi:hypothetical protein CJ030_MR7G005996 [Morella rubra]|uniref:Uncharacterized protein n=1 Tax=Morella rubra TaxID=262757 RepID=A0A6A1V0B7_9ROSI|nr:hypothetical protein CJ030_MR7G005996 [Morella rubra]
MCKGFDYGEALVYLLGNGVAANAPRKIHVNQLPIRSRLLHLICTYNLIPRGGHREVVTFMDVFLIESLLKEKKFSLPYIMLKNMKQLASYEDADVDDNKDEDVVEAEDEPEGEEVDAEAMEFDVDADMVDDPPIIPSPTKVPDPTSSFDTQFIAFKWRITTMHEAQKKFLDERFTSMEKEQRKFFEEMKTFMARFPPPS